MPLHPMARHARRLFAAAGTVLLAACTAGGNAPAGSAGIADSAASAAAAASAPGAGATPSTRP